MRATWYEALLWARNRGPFSTIDLALALKDTTEWKKRKNQAHTVLHKLWKWGLLRKASKLNELPRTEIKRLLAVELRGPLTDGYKRQGRHPAIWILTKKGARRAAKPKIK